MHIKGFREGKVPTGVVKKMYGRTILVEEVNHLLSHSVSDYIKEKKLTVLGDPIPNHEKARQIDWDNQKDFEFEFQIGMVENFNVELSSKVKLNSYRIDVDDKVVNEAIEDMKRRFGTVTNPEVSSAEDNVFGEVTGPDGGASKSSYVQIPKLKSGEQKKFIGLKKDDTVTFDVEKLTADPADLSRIMNVTEAEASSLMGTYTLRVTNISHMVPVEHNQELYDKVFGKNVVTGDVEFVEKVRKTISENYERESNHLLEHEIEHYLVDHTKVNMPDAFLRTWLKTTGEGKITEEVLGKEFEDYKKGLKWGLIKNKLAETLNVKVEQGDVRERAKLLIAQQFGGPAIIEQLGDKFNTIADNYLSGRDGKGENFMRVYNQIRHEKLMKAIKEQIAVTEKAVSLEEFRKASEAHAHE